MNNARPIYTGIEQTEKSSAVSNQENFLTPKKWHLAHIKSAFGSL